MGMFYGSMTHSYNGKKRKTKAFSKPRKRSNVSTGETMKIPQHILDRQAEMEAFNKRYPSMTSATSKYVPNEDDSWKREESKNWTVAPAYNKGAYQVIPKSNIKDIGR